MIHNIINIIGDEEKQISTFADLFFHDDNSDRSEPNTIRTIHTSDKSKNVTDVTDDWRSPSDFLIGKINLIPPFTSKITRGITHEGILTLGDEILVKEHAKFLKRLEELLKNNDAAWEDILTYEKAAVVKKVKSAFAQIFENKCKIMNKEISAFYEKSLKELESYIKIQFNDVLIGTHADVISKLNAKIREKLIQEKRILDKDLNRQFVREICKIKNYYKILLDNEQRRCSALVNRLIVDRNDTVKAFCKQIESEKLSSTMYVMCTERKKCKIKQFLMEKYQGLELKEMYEKLNEKHKVSQAYAERDIKISHLNKDWEEKIQKVLKLFLKFISFSLRLLPEQTGFLIDFQKMVTLQLNEIKKMPAMSSSLLIDEDCLNNVISLEKHELTKKECKNEPFVIVGDLSDPIPTRYGSSETLPPEVDLPTVRLQRQFIYAKCHKYEEIKAMLLEQKCKCNKFFIKDQHESESNVSQISVGATPQDVEAEVEPESSNELLTFDEYKICKQCPSKKCRDWVKEYSFPNLNSYLDYDEKKYKTVKAILDKSLKGDITSDYLEVNINELKHLPFAATNEPYHHVMTQCSSQEGLPEQEISCGCLDSLTAFKDKPAVVKMSKESFKNQRKNNVINLIQKYPSMAKLFTEESTDFQY